MHPITLPRYSLQVGGGSLKEKLQCKAAEAPKPPFHPRVPRDNCQQPSTGHRLAVMCRLAVKHRGLGVDRRRLMVHLQQSAVNPTTGVGCSVGITKAFNDSRWFENDHLPVTLHYWSTPMYPPLQPTKGEVGTSAFVAPLIIPGFPLPKKSNLKPSLQEHPVSVTDRQNTAEGEDLNARCAFFLRGGVSVLWPYTKRNSL